MWVPVKCGNCSWIGTALVTSKGAVRLADQECPRCGSEIRRTGGRGHKAIERAKLSMERMQRRKGSEKRG